MFKRSQARSSAQRKREKVKCTNCPREYCYSCKQHWHEGDCLKDSDEAIKIEEKVTLSLSLSLNLFDQNASLCYSPSLSIVTKLPQGAGLKIQKRRGKTRRGEAGGRGQSQTTIIIVAYLT